MTKRPAHWLRTNRAARTPRWVIFLDSEARKEKRPGVEVQTFRLAVAGVVSEVRELVPADFEEDAS